MSFTSLLVHDVTIVHPGIVVDRYGNIAKDWASATRKAAKGRVARRQQNEVRGNREAQVSEWVLYLLADETISGGDRVEWDLVTFEVNGPPNPAPARTSAVHHIEAELLVVEG